MVGYLTCFDLKSYVSPGDSRSLLYVPVGIFFKKVEIRDKCV